MLEIKKYGLKNEPNHEKQLKAMSDENHQV